MTWLGPIALILVCGALLWIGCRVNRHRRVVGCACGRECESYYAPDPEALRAAARRVGDRCPVCRAQRRARDLRSRHVRAYARRNGRTCAPSPQPAEQQ